MRNLQFSRLFAEEGAGSSTPGPLTIDATVEALNAEEPKETLDLTGESDKETEEAGEETPAAPDELAELEEELKGPEEKDLELVTPVRRRDILEKYPNVFKDFPYLEKAYYREQQFTETFPTIQDAKNAAQKADFLDTLEQQVLQGDITTVLQAAKTNDPNTFARLADNYLPALRHVDQQAYYHVLGNVIKDTIITMVREGRALGEQGAPLQAAANILNQFVFGSQNFTPPQNLARQVNPEEQTREQEYQNREQQRFMGQFVSVRDDLQVRADNVLKATIDEHIDPNKSMTDYVKSHARNDAFGKLEDLMSKDSRFHVLLDQLWERAFQDGFSKESTDRIKSAYLSKAKTLLPTVIKAARNEALRGSNGQYRSDEERPARRGPIQPGKSTPPSSGKITKPSEIPKGMSTLDFLNS